MKKSYYKDLEKEGYGGSGANGGELGVRKVKVVKPIHGEQRRGAVEEDEEVDEEYDEQVEDEVDEEERHSDSEDSDDDMKRKIKSKSRNSNPFARSQPPARSNDAKTAPSITGSASRNANSNSNTAPIKKPRLSSPELAAIREQKASERKEWGKRSSRGQPKLGGRVEMLLAKLKKSMAN